MELSKEPNLFILNSDDFIPDKYVHDLSQQCVGGPELRRLRKKIQGFYEETSNSLKKNVYQNYMQFIDTAKEISNLESEMYQLSHLLSEQKSLLSALSTTSILGEETQILNDLDNKDNNNEDENRQKLIAVSEKVDDCNVNVHPKEFPNPSLSKHLLLQDLLNKSGRIYLYEGDLLEVDPVDNNVIKSVHAYLFNDGFMITGRNPNRNLNKYTFEIMYELSSLAVVDVKDMGGNKHAFKLLNFPDTRVFQCNSNSNKKEWLEKFDQAKKARLTQESQKRESIIERAASRTTSIASMSIHSLDEELPLIHPEWFLEIPEELDVCVAQRHFEDALTFLQKAKTYLEQLKTNQTQLDHIALDIESKINQRYKHLTEVLMKELEVNPDKSLQGGLRAARRAVRLLNQLGQSTQACKLFLKLCSSMLKGQYKRVKREGNITMYVRHLSSVVFTNMCHMTEEFLRAFPSSSSCFSAYVVWACNELSLFTIHFIKQVFMPQTSLATITECVITVRSQCDRLCSFGIDLCYQLDGALRTSLTQSLRDARDKLIDATKLRAIEDKWIPTNFHTKLALNRCIQEYNDMGLHLDTYISGDVWIQLTSNTMAFVKLFSNLLDDCLKLRTTELMFTIDEILRDVFEAHVKYIEQALKNEARLEQKQFMVKNVEFVLDPFYTIVQKKYCDINGYECKSLIELQMQYLAMAKGVLPTNRNTKTKYSSEFL